LYTCDTCESMTSCVHSYIFHLRRFFLRRFSGNHNNLHMVARAKSDRLKGHENQRRKELSIKAAVHKYEREQAKPPSLGKPKSIRAIAEGHKVSCGTLNRRIHGGRSTVEANQERQKITPTQEWSLVQFMRESADQGFPLMHAQIEQHANAIRKPRSVQIASRWERNGYSCSLIDTMPCFRHFGAKPLIPSAHGA
jgi:hypothetical protein